MRSDSERLADILDAVQRIRRHVKVGDRQRFEEDEVVRGNRMGTTTIRPQGLDTRASRMR
jgi:hypothetical protein